VTAVLSAACLATAVQAAHWPAWRGADGNGVTQEKNLPVSWSATNNVRWKIDLPERGNSTPIVWGNRIFLTQPAGKLRTLLCLNRADGKQLWQRGLAWEEAEETHETNPYCSASPATDGQRVVAWFGSAGVACYDFEGKELWKRDFGKQVHEWGYGSSPVLHGDLCFLYHGPGPGARLLALDKKSGKTVWEFTEPAAKTEGRPDGFRGRGPGVVGSWSTPLLIRAGAREELVMSFPTLLAAFDPKSGKQLWHCDGLNPLVYTSPVHGEGVVVAMGGFFGSSLAVKLGGNGNVTESSRLWHEPRAKKNRCGSAVVKDGHVYLMNMEGFAECLDLKTGVEVWQERLPAKGAKGNSWSSMVLAGDLIYILNQSSDCIVLRGSPKFEVVGVNPLDGAMNNASVAVSDGELLIRTHSHLWCIGGKKSVASR
jgi:outer membrane protein assembly factor BamB